MKDKTKEQLLGEIRKLTERLAKYEGAEIPLQDSLQQSEARFETLIEYSTDLIFLVNNNFQVQSVNSKAAEVLGKEPAEIVGKSVEELFPQYIAKSYQKSLMQIFKLGIAETFESVLPTKEKKLWIRTAMNPVKDNSGKTVAILGVSRDISRSKMTAKALRKSESKFQSILASMNDLVFVFDTEGRYTFCHSAEKKNLYVKPEDFLGKTTSEVLPANISKMFNEALEKNKNRQTVTEEYELKVPNGTKWFSMSISPMIVDEKFTGSVAVVRDITTHKTDEKKLNAINQQLHASEQQLRASNQQLYANEQQLRATNMQLTAREKFLDSVIEQSPFATWISDSKGTMLRSNPALKKLLNLTDEQLIGKYNILEDKIAERAGIMPLIKTVFDEGNSINVTLEWDGNDMPNMDLRGSESIICEATMFPIHDTEGKLTNVVCNWIDISERKNTQEKLKNKNIELLAAIKEANKNKRYFQSLFEQSAISIQIFDNNGLTLDANKAWENLWLASKSQVIGKYNVLKDKSVQGTEWLMKFKKSFTGETVDLPDLEYNPANIREKGRMRIIKCLAFPIKNKDKTESVVLMHQDITDRKQAEEALKESEEKYRNLVENIEEGISKVDKNEKFTYVNRAACKILGFSENELLEMSLMDMTATEEFNKILKQTENRKKGEVNSYELEIARKDGSKVIILVTSSPIKSTKNEYLGGFGIFQDITERKKSEKKLKDALERALESDRLKSAFLANMSHEIRTPMNGVLGFVNLLNAPETSQEEKKEFTKIIHKSSNRLMNTINDIIDISKIDAGQMKISQKETSINSLIEELYKFFDHEAKAKGINLIFAMALSNKEATVLTDSDKLHGILINLIKNAIKYSRKGRINFGYFPRDEYIEFFVKDTGIGIPKNRLKAIFNRFEQADIEDSKVYEGSGLGLSIAKAYVEMLGGKIWVKSEEEDIANGKPGWSNFSFNIPFKKLKPATKSMSKKITIENESFDSKKLKILIVEDDEVSTIFLNNVLKNKLHEILHVDTGKKAVELCRNMPDIDIVLMDIKIPDMNGYEATREIRKFNKEILIIAQTAYGLAGDREKALATGCNDYISKPINRIELKDKIAKLVT
ncbi:MAG: PAS domain S-box protein [Bacteroidetes bacterium]|nr:PAS domain S-box protein [Bacteroidota bacterium]MBT6685045.1 PAS domain S-box protein [Bacteroidota bacterium]MBT7143184.1 PAS domain S-box protein [Bacteroidota bacterium]MBT7491006.1 PAS domain S-box protein [Bacteroidota bacterium]